MTATLKVLVTSPRELVWWQWMKLVSAVALVLLAFALLIGVRVPLVIQRVVLHLALDFALQSNWVAAGKVQRKRALIVHSTIAALPAIASESVATVILSLVVYSLSHYIIDYTRKFGIENMKLGAIVDQAAHLIVLCA